MTMKTDWIGRALLFVFVVSGFAGLIYQSIWSHYLGLVLGHAAYAQSLVLAIFMGGMSLGAWLAARWSTGWRELIRAYAAIELLIGLIGVAFHPIFVGYVDVSQNTILPALGADWVAHAYQWSTAALLIAPQCILLGMTFPLLSAGYLRLAPNDDGRVLGGLYFSNSIGAAAGALACTFVLLPLVGMPGSTLAAGLLNIFVALVAWPLGRMAESVEQRPVATTHERVSPGVSSGSPALTARFVFAAAAITGATSFIYEIGWVRLLNQALGTTVHSFELMLAAFIAGLAFGGNWIRRRGAEIADPASYAGVAQILMGLAALLSLPVFAHSFGMVEWLLSALARTGEGYTVFSAGSAVVALLVMFPAAFFAGMTLPLFTMSLLRAGAGESSIGRIYAFNTLGAIAGVFLTVHVLIPSIGVSLSVALSALIDIALGLFLLSGSTLGWRRLAIIGVCGVIAAASLVAGRIDPRSQVAGVFRTGVTRLQSVTGIPYLRDGKTATVSVSTMARGAGMIATNGKPDAALALRLKDPPEQDEATMIMAGILPIYLRPSAKTVGVIGWGSGLTTHTLLGFPQLTAVETVEIERAMIDGSRHFGERVERAFNDPRSRAVIDDARTYFSTKGKKYDVIVSEPSNPWVSGVASLFTKEFYGFLRGHLNQGGLLVQWIQTYELSDALLATMGAAIVEQFPHVQIYITNTADMLFVASPDKLGDADWGVMQHEPLLSEIRRIGFRSADEIRLRYVGDERLLKNLARLYGIEAHSDFYPTVSLRAPKSRFIDDRATLLLRSAINGMPLLDFLIGRTPLRADADVEVSAFSVFSVRHRIASEVVASARAGSISPLLVEHSPADAKSLEALLELSAQPGDDDAWLRAWSTAASEVASATLGLLPSEDLQELWIQPRWAGALTGFPAQAMLAYQAAARRDAPETRRNALLALDQATDAVLGVQKEQMLMLAMAASIGEGRKHGAEEIERQYGKAIPPSAVYGQLRSFLLAWE
jgi:predicted membrane-bound spermidine synthase